MQFVHSHQVSCSDAGRRCFFVCQCVNKKQKAYKYAGEIKDNVIGIGMKGVGGGGDLD